MTCSSLAFVAPSVSLLPSLVATRRRSVSTPPPRGSYCHQCLHSTKLFQNKPSSLQEENDKEEEDDDYFLQRELARIESLDSNNSNIPTNDKDDDDDDDDWTASAFHDFHDDDDDLEFPHEEELQELEQSLFGTTILQWTPKSAETLEQALRQGVVPADAGVGSASLAGDFGFDPLHLSDKDYIGNVQNCIVHFIPGETNTNDGTPFQQPKEPQQERPRALILRDYREAEIRHGRLAMLAAVFWPLQEMLDRFFFKGDDFGSVVGNLIRGGKTLPYIPLVMTFLMLLLGYLDIFRQELKANEQLGEAFEPGDCFWDPLSILVGAPDSMKRNMQERELFNARMAMIAIAVYIWEEARRGQPIISIPGNELLFEPFYQVPYIQEWLDSLFGSATPPTAFPFEPFDVLQLERVGGGVSLDDVTGME